MVLLLVDAAMQKGLQRLLDIKVRFEARMLSILEFAM